MISWQKDSQINVFDILQIEKDWDLADEGENSKAQIEIGKGAMPPVIMVLFVMALVILRPVNYKTLVILTPVNKTSLVMMTALVILAYLVINYNNTSYSNICSYYNTF